LKSSELLSLAYFVFTNFQENFKALFSISSASLTFKNYGSIATNSFFCLMIIMDCKMQLKRD
jgi:hypothetical protein